jgi:tryptophan halogenase
MGDQPERDVAEFNDQQFQDMEQIRDFVILHYKVDRPPRFAPSGGSARRWTCPTAWQQKIELFRETGRVFRKNEELFAENSWVQVMMGQGIEPQHGTRSRAS